ncbi:MAG: response regulator [Gammaproteobacteria bacterium]|nr:response regulator [Gammaproteobacteria bacterium]MBU1655590.1 response regulator [Gammaproteobacteria bacterium]MBU1961871.1 response regulator [Gammaproteobacteria bacterium]
MENLLLKLFGLKEERRDSAPEEKAVPAKGKILVVDDSKTFQHMVQRILKSEGYESLQALTGEDGIKMAERFRPDLIIMDVVLPGINGFQATRQLKKNLETKHIPVIIVSGNAQATEQFWVLKIGAVDFMTKPFARKDLVAKLEEHLGANLAD